MSAETAAVEPYTHDWLALQCRMIPRVERGLVALCDGQAQALREVATWPDASPAHAGLSDAAALVMQKRSSVVCHNRHADDSTDSDRLSLACPLLVDGQQVGAVAVEVRNTSEQQQRAVMQLLEWGGTWLEFLGRRDTGGMNTTFLAAFRVIATALERQRFSDAVIASVNELASSLMCNRVSIGFRQAQKVELNAVSGAARPAKGTNLVRDLEAVMDESIDQEDTVSYPKEPGTALQPCSAHRHFFDKHGEGALCTVPLGNDEHIYGALCFERSADMAFEPKTVELCEVIASMLGPMLELKRRDDRSLPRHLWECIRDFVHRLVGPRHLLLKLASVGSVVVLAAATFVSAPYRISAPAALEGTIQRAVVAPIEGYIAAAHVRAGDLVRADQSLGRLEDTELNLERTRWEAQRNQLQKTYRQALATRDRAQIGILNAQIAQAEAQMSLLDEQLKRTELIAPFDGIVVTGDLSQELGSPVERGETLFEIAPLESYRVVLNVPEQDIGEIAQEQTGLVALAGLPGQTFPFVVERIAPISTAADGGTHFRVDAMLTGESTRLLPGMQGVAKVAVGERRLWSIATRKLLLWLRLQFWMFRP